jgi:diguanylate cyclase (GGDEF)-like protein
MPLYQRCLSIWILAICMGMQHAVALGATIELSPKELRYLHAHNPISVCIDPDWVPFESFNPQGQPEGIATDLLNLAAQRAGIHLVRLNTKTWPESLQASKDQRCQLLNFINQSPERAKWLIFTQPLFTDANVFLARAEHGFIANAHALSGERIVLPRGTSIEERVRTDYPNLKILNTESEAQALQMVSDHQADMTLRSLTIAAYTIRKEGWFNLKIAGQAPGYDNQLRVGVLRHDDTLRDILDKGIATITPTERDQIVNRHIAITVEEPIDYRLLAQLGLVFLLILFINLYWLIRLRRVNGQLRVKSETDSLTGIANRAELNRRFSQQLAQAQQHGQPFSIILLDVDNFKQVNDEYGHLSGDKILVAISALLAQTIRQRDTVGRWGGEEFLVLCPDTSQEQAMRLAERLCSATRNHVFDPALTATISAGVTAQQSDDQIDDLLQRADQALYQAKNRGRDQACLA